jgi:cytochrome b
MELNNSTHPTSALVKIHINAFNLSSLNFPLHIAKYFLLQQRAGNRDNR